MCTCPLCKRQFAERPLLNINRVFALIADKYKHARYGTPLVGSPAAAGGFDEQPGPGGFAATNPFAPAPPPSSDPGPAAVNCDICTGLKRPAVSSCLVCTAAYCEEHLQPHRTSAFYASHSLLDPQEALRGRTCTQHKHLLEVRAGGRTGGRRRRRRCPPRGYWAEPVTVMLGRWVLV